MVLKKLGYGLRPLTNSLAPPFISRRRAVIELILAAFIWGFSFVATKWGLTSFTPIELLILRFFIGVISGELLHLCLFRQGFTFDIDEVRKAFPAAVLLAAFLVPQTIGMLYTTATNSGFLTTMYIIFVPVLNHFFFKVSTSPKIYITVAIAVVGAFLLMGGHFNSVNKGDLVTLICAVAGALHIIYLGRVSRYVKDVIRFNNWQTFFCLVIVLPVIGLQVYGQGGWQGILRHAPISPIAWAGLIFLGFGSSAVAFIFQIRGQKVLSDTTSSMLFLLESPFAFAFGYLLLEERLNPIQWAGAMVILISSCLTILWDSSSHSNKQPKQ